MSEIAKHWIDGEWPGSDTVSESINPATRAVTLEHHGLCSVVG